MKCFLIILLGFSFVRAGHVEFVESDADLAVFEREHPHRRLVLYDPTNRRSLEILAKARADDSVIPTAAVRVAALTGSLSKEAVPRVIFVSPPTRRNLAQKPANVFAYGAHGDAARGDHVLVLVGHQNTALAIRLVAEAAADNPELPHLYAQVGKPKTHQLMKDFGFKAWKENEYHVIKGKRAVKSFRFSSELQWNALLH